MYQNRGKELIGELLSLSPPFFICISPVSPETKKLKSYSSLASSRSYFPIIIFLSPSPSYQSLAASFFLSLLGGEMSDRHIQTPPVRISASVTNESHLSFSLSPHAFGQSSEHHSRKSIPIRVGAVWCSHFILTHSPLMAMRLGLTFLNNRGWQPTSCFFQMSF